MPPLESKPPTQVRPVLREYWKATLQYPGLFTLVILGGLIIEASGIISPLFLKQFIDTLSLNTPSDLTLVALFTTLGFFALAALLGWFGQRLRQYSLGHLEANVMGDLSRQAFAYLMGHAHDFFVSNFAGTLTRRVNRFARSYEPVFDSFSFQFVSLSVYSVGVIAVLSIKNPLLGLALFVWTLFFIWVQIALARWRQPLRITRAAEDSRVTGVLSDAVGNHSAISLYATGVYERSIFGDAIERWRAATMRSWDADNWIYAVQGLFVITIEVGLLAGAVLLWQRGLITVGDFVLIQVYVLGLIDRVWNVGQTMRRLYDAFADAYEMVAIFEAPHAVADLPSATELQVGKGSIDFKNVEFNFSGTRSILEDFDLHIEGGEKVALVGPSGAGKSTVTKLLLRLYDVTGGHIEIDGQDTMHATQDSLRKAISFVPQEPVLFHRPLIDNIRYGRLDASEEEVIDAAKKAHCHEFISQLPQGYDTLVGERGVKLSGGERQRVAIARAILKNAPILVLDEATSSLDSESEHLIQDALNVLMEGKTVIVIAHRLSTIMKMDRIIVIEAGKVVDEGTHDELLDKGSGLYHKLWSIQAGSFLADES